MGIFRPDRAPRKQPDAWLPLKAALFVTGALAAVVGMALRQDWLVTAAVVPLALGVGLRFLRPR